jgi:23S rRNA pseudouridine1911/1915/1917 synthase
MNQCLQQINEKKDNIGDKMNKLNVIYEDNHIIVVEKEPNILSQSDATKDQDMLTRVKAYIKEEYHKPGNVYIGLVQRLDRPVGGLMVFARSSKAASRLSLEIRNHEVKKTYLAVIDGLLPKDKDTLEDKLLKLDDGNTIIDSKGKDAILHYEVLARDEKTKRTLVKINLETGRHHQIRVQFSSRGYPLCGDKRYGQAASTYDIALFAYALEFVHPTTKEVLKFELPIPKNGYWTPFTVSK